VGVKSTRYAQVNNFISLFRPFSVTANVYFLDTRRRINGSFVSSQKMRQKSLTAIWVLKKLCGGLPPDPRIKERGQEEGRSMGRVGAGEGVKEEGVREGEVFQPPIFLATRRLWYFHFRKMVGITLRTAFLP
jgi:hypothetical protein